LEVVYFTLAAILFYLAADRILNRIERAAGRRFEYRSFYFFGILLALAVIGFWVIRQLGGA